MSRVESREVSVHANVSADGTAMTIDVAGHFDLSVHRAFRDAYELLRRDGAQYVVDLSRTESMDSTALGMLLMLRKHAGGEGARVRITNCRDEIRRVLTLANFQKLFSIE